ncbi:MAG: T9SS type A sorting domain-containing protein [candidate division KSB1 bacterium]|nr:T9SS type A sorting domain-containing protein [candidate division KSB1 bacterium]MDZ7272964.1 T9SS type A sorting domain-containing protein [candidate division KSB1 bacterium]MDZ7285068.1 T9SS type A sorting domain-containing protein [candidate division KSB1 bacterium]MDZ7298100.1 T9SS type A sorting domain-containing protein [candidate division KSB1 bacterium]MDZ7308223.1 T9SS type A sorting domain-containing protein [candidate division KSB1 bacterium]
MLCNKIFRWCSVFALLAAAAGVRADYKVTGRFLYQDLEFDRKGFTGVRPDKPIRLADVLILDTSTNSVVARGATDLNGEFSITVNDNAIRTIAVVVVANSQNTPGLHQAVMVMTSTSRNGTTPHAFEGAVSPNHNPTQDFDMGTAVARYRAGGEPFNIYDNMLDNADFLKAIDGARPQAPIKTIVNFDIKRTDDFAYYSAGAGPGGGVFLGPKYGYDDTIILHELGHYVERNYGDFDDNPGGRHFIGDSAQDPRLSWGEGWPTFWASHVRLWRGDKNPSVYLNSLGDSTRNRLSFSYDLEDREGEGASSENAVQSALWDMTDGPDTPDATHGIDDEPGYAMTRPFAETWFVTSFLMSTLTEPQSFEDFVDAWNAGITNPQSVTLNEMLYRNHNIQFFPDEFEDDNTLDRAVRLSYAQVGGGVATHHTHFPEGDEDWLVFDAFASVKYMVSTSTMRDGADTYLSLHTADGFVLADNDNVGNPTPGENNAFELLRSSIQYQPAKNGPLYIRCRRSTANRNAKFGNYDLRVLAVEVGPEAPNLQVSPTSVVVSVRQGEERERLLFLTNTGTADTLVYELEEQQRDLRVFDFPWLAVAPLRGRLSPGKSDTIKVKLTSAAANLGQNVARLEIRSNDPDNSARPVAVVLNVTQATAVAEEQAAAALPLAFALQQNYPNPLLLSQENGAPAITRIDFDIPAQAAGGVAVTLRVYDILGREVRTLVQEVKQPGRFTAIWDGRDQDGAWVRNGVYFYKISAGNFSTVRKLMVVR